MNEADSQRNLPDAVQLWMNFRDYIQIGVDVEGSDSSEPESPVIVGVTVTNTAPASDDWPEIEFEGVNVNINLRGMLTNRFIGGLPPGKSEKIEVTYKYGELPGLSFNVEGSVSSRKFFQIRRSMEIPVSFTHPTVTMFLAEFNKVGIHDPLNSIRGPILGMNSDPTVLVAEVRSVAPVLEMCLAMADERREALQQLLSNARLSGAEFTNHLNEASDYLGKVKESCQEIKNAFASTELVNIDTAKTIVSGLDEDAKRVNQLTEALMDKYGISDDQVNYRLQEASS